ncbi:hypothetical protein SH661x_001921 [Planctomicrobium sp. SH661]|uniref:hypothetical protein n=1 Tax=Planctomicrobium sp. SH661 TaxID=3448124 RepID=UPI003F5C51F9
MTVADHRQFLESRGFIVARDPFPGTSGPLWFAQEPAIDPRIKREKFGPHNLFIDLATGSWQHWGEQTWHRFDVGPWNELIEEESPDLSTLNSQHSTSTGEREADSADRSEAPPPLPPELHCFFAQCLAAGFAWDDRLNRECNHVVSGWETGNRWMLRDDVSWLVSSRTQTINGRVNGIIEALPLSHFTGSARSVSTPAPLPRRELSAVGVVVQSSGRSLQKGFF